MISEILQNQRVCPICKNKQYFVFEGRILDKYLVSYFKCDVCKILNTEEPYWLEEAYSESISMFDIGLVNRNLNLAPIVARIIEQYFDKYGLFLDYAGGYGLLVRMMRDRGFNFYRYDKYCQNIFAKYFEIVHINQDSHFNLVTAFELLEHCTDPLAEMGILLSVSDAVLFSTVLQKQTISSVDDWWYLVPETGQHITFYSIETLERIAFELQATLYSNNKDLHLISKKPIHGFRFTERKFTAIKRRIFDLFKQAVGCNTFNEMECSISKDYIYIKKLFEQREKPDFE